jgi:hypothetical protein
VAPAESALRTLTATQARAQRAVDEATVDEQPQATAEATRIAALVEQANQQTQVVREAAAAATSAAERDDLSAAREAGERAVAAAEQVRQLQQAATPQTEDQTDAPAPSGDPNPEQAE